MWKRSKIGTLHSLNSFRNSNREVLEESNELPPHHNRFDSKEIDSPIVESSKLDISDQGFVNQLKQRQLNFASCPLSVSVITSCFASYSTLTIVSNGTTTLSVYGACSSSSTSYDTCSSSESISCGATCTTFTVSATGYTYYFVTSYVSNAYGAYPVVSIESSNSDSFSTEISYGCQALTAACSAQTAASSALSSASSLSLRLTFMTIAVGLGAVAGAAVGAGIALGIGQGQNTGASAIESIDPESALNFIEPSVVQFETEGPIAQVPTNFENIPVPGPNFPNPGGCNDGSVLFNATGTCEAVMRRGPCTDPNEWFIVDPTTLLVQQFIRAHYEIRFNQTSF